jgi:hypothetical protein
LLLCISAAIWRCQVSTQSHEMTFRRVGHPNVTKRARTTVLATMVCCRCGLEVRFRSVSGPSVTIFPSSGGPKGEKGWQRPSILPKREMGICSDRICILQRHLDVPSLEGIFRNPARAEEGRDSRQACSSCLVYCTRRSNFEL